MFPTLSLSLSPLCVTAIDHIPGLEPVGVTFNSLQQKQLPMEENIFLLTFKKGDFHSPLNQTSGSVRRKQALSPSGLSISEVVQLQHAGGPHSPQPDLLTP